ncbi:MAG: response regulator [Aestuariivita sp.]|nr:response regulator [Aestuariivita sp.]MCY4346405.1 response regulator [Aestuariivita sp.]
MSVDAAASHILIVDDDERIRELLKKYLLQHGYRVTAAGDAERARRLLLGIEFDFVILDVMMPGEDGVTLTRSVREHLNTPILLLTARSEIEDRIDGLEAGADDYLVKPFDPKELVLRINAILRRMPETVPLGSSRNILKLGQVQYDVRLGKMHRGSELVLLTATESQLMQIFARSLGKVFERAKLVEILGRGRETAQERAIDVQVTRLRRKIEDDPKQPKYLQTVRSAGYMLVSD